MLLSECVCVCLCASVCLKRVIRGQVAAVQDCRASQPTGLYAAPRFQELVKIAASTCKICGIYEMKSRWHFKRSRGFSIWPPIFFRSAHHPAPFARPVCLSFTAVSVFASRLTALTFQEPSHTRWIKKCGGRRSEKSTPLQVKWKVKGAGVSSQYVSKAKTMKKQKVAGCLLHQSQRGAFLD